MGCSCCIHRYPHKSLQLPLQSDSFPFNNLWSEQDVEASFHLKQVWTFRPNWKIGDLGVSFFGPTDKGLIMLIRGVQTEYERSSGAVRSGEDSCRPIRWSTVPGWDQTDIMTYTVFRGPGSLIFRGVGMFMYFLKHILPFLLTQLSPTVQRRRWREPPSTSFQALHPLK